MTTDKQVKKIAFKTKVMNAILYQNFVTNLDDQIAYLQEICRDMKREENKQLKRG